MNYKFDTLKILKYKEQSVLAATGSLFCAPGHIEMNLIVNHQTYASNAFILPVGKGKDQIEHSFELEVAGLPALISDICIEIVNGNKSEGKINLNKESLSKLVIESSILYHIDSVNFNNNGLATVNGWVISLANEKVDISVKENSEPIDCSYHRTLRQRLYERGVVKRENMFAGFTLSFYGEASKQYQLCLEDGITELSVELNSLIITPDFNKRIKNLLNKVNRKNFERAIRYIQTNGIIGFFKRLKDPIEDLPDYNAWFIRNRVTDKELQEQAKTEFAYSPKISVLVPVFNTPKKLLCEMMDSVINQSYSNWQLCIADASSEGNEASEIVDGYCKKDPRIICNHLHANYGISDNTNKALELADGDYIALFDHDDLLEPDCLYEIIKSLQKHKYNILYTDEDKLNDETGELEDPNFKPDYNPDLLLSHNYITHFFVVNREIIRKTGGFNKKYDGSQDYDMILRCIEESKDICHIPKSLYHWRMHKGSTAADPKSKMYCYVAGEKALNDHLKRVGIKATAKMMPEPLWGIYHIYYEIPDNPLVSIVIPSCDHVELLKRCVDSLLKKNVYHNIEIIIVENNSKKSDTFKYYKKVQSENSNVRVITWKGKDFNFSAINNYGVSHANGEYILLLNNDTEIIQPTALKEMLGLCMRKDVGCVGAKLLYEDNTIQHAGVILGFSGYAEHVFTRVDNDKEFGYVRQAVCNMDYSAVTAACMMTKKSVFELSGGLDEKLKVAGNDVDYCLKVVQLGYRVVYNSNALWHHYESKSRGYENSLDKIKRFDQEVTLFQEKWNQVLINGDPAYNPNFKIEDAPYLIV